MSDNTIKCSFSLLDEGRVYTGRHRKYLINNAREVCYSPAVREKIKLREALGYYGHGRRILAGRMHIEEVEAVKTPDGGSAIISNIPSNVTVSFDVAEDGTIRHSQEILDTETGKIVSGLNSSRIGGFSWACPGVDGGKNGVTRLSGFAGFDYVLSPGFAHNRGYVLESADSDMEQMILESVAATVRDDKKAERYVKGWMQDFNSRAMDLEDRLFHLEAKHAEVIDERDTLARMAANAQKEKDTALAAKAQQMEGVKKVFDALAGTLPFFIPENGMHAMMNGDFDRARQIFESAAKIDYGQLPLSVNNKGKKPLLPKAQDMPDYGSVAYGEGMFREGF